jgi:hypothetical protein
VFEPNHSSVRGLGRGVKNWGLASHTSEFYSSYNHLRLCDYKNKNNKPLHRMVVLIKGTKCGGLRGINLVIIVQ